jgi:hypothetical protein
MNARRNTLVIVALSGALLFGLTSTAEASPAGGDQGSAPAAHSPKVRNFTNKFTRSTAGWCNVNGWTCDGMPGDAGTITRTESDSSTNAYAPDIAAQSGHWYATVDGATEGTAVCPTYPSEDESCDGPYTSWGNRKGNYDTFPSDGFRTSLDIYLDTSWANANPGIEFEWDTGVNQSDGQFGQDVLFTAQTGSGGFTVGAGNNTQSSVPTPTATIGTSGWYRFSEAFAVNASTGEVEATLSITDDATASPVPGASWVLPVVFNGVPATPSEMGGPLYGWFPNENIPELPIDNSTLQKG